MADEGSRAKILKEALRARHHEAFEKALGRAVRLLGGDYAQYRAIIEDLRAYSRANRTDLRTAARALSHQL